MVGADDLDALKSDGGCLRIYGQYVSGLKRAGSLFTGRCPLHADSSPSFSVYPDMRWTCFSGPDCGSGNIFQLIERVDGVSFQQAVEQVKKELGKEDSWSRDKDRVEKTFKPVSEKKSYKTIPLSSWVKAETALSENTKARAWLLKERGITYETAKRLHIGYVQNIGPLAGEEGKDIADKGWVGFPSVDGDTVRLVKFRSIERKKPGGFARMVGMETVLFNTNSLDPFEPVYLVSGEFDAMVLEQAGLRAVSLASDTHKPTPEQKDQLMSASLVFLAGDTDAKGAETMDRLWKELGDRAYRLIWPEGSKDANDCFLKHCGSNQFKFIQLVDDLTRKAKSQPMPDVYSIQEVMEHGEDKSLADREDRLRFPWSEVDKAAILLPGSVCGVMATSSGQGKTAFTLQYSLFGARKYNETVINWQCELSPSEISVMVAAQVLRKNRNFITKEDLKEAAKQLDGVNYYVGNNSTINNIMDVLDIMEAAIRRLGATQAVLDNAHFYTSGVDDDVRILAAAMKRIKQIAVTYGVKFSVVFQPRKASSQSRGKKTQLSDVKGSASAGDTCDAVVAIHRDLNKDEEKMDAYEDKTLVEWLKTRSKGTGKASAILTFFGEMASFEQIEHNYEEVPA